MVYSSWLAMQHLGTTKDAKGGSGGSSSRKSSEARKLAEARRAARVRRGG